MDILSYIDNDEIGRLIAQLPPSCIAPDNSLPDDKPRLAVVQLSTEERRTLALQLVRKRIPVAILGTSEHGYLAGLSASARRNHVPAVLLESWRYIPAVATAKEICASGCLGKLLECRMAAHCRNELEMARIRDVASWLGAPLVYLEAESDVQLSLSAQNGSLQTTFSLDGQRAHFTVTIAGHTHDRIIPAANPLLSELAILSLSLPQTGRIKSLPLLMEC